MVYLFLADGFETIEALTVVDMLRRAGISIETVSINAGKEVTSGQKITVIADRTIEEVKDKDADMLVCPGGIPGAPNLRADERVVAMLKKNYETDRYVAAICASPAVVLGDLGMLDGRKATVYPSFEEELAAKGITLTDEAATVDGKVITGQGMAAAIKFSAAIITELADDKLAKKVLDSIVYRG